MKTCSLLYSCLLHSLRTSNGCNKERTDSTEHARFYYAMIHPPAQVFFMRYIAQDPRKTLSTLKGITRSSLSLTTHIIHQSPCPFVCLFYHQEGWVHRGDRVPDPIPELNQAPDCSSNEQQDQGRPFWTPVAPGLEHAQMFRGMAPAGQLHTGVYWLEVKIRNTKNNSSTTWLFKQNRNEHNVQI